MTKKPQRRGFFVTGTDTCVGKTSVSVALLRALRRAEIQAVGMKPVASGCQLRQGRLISEDALLLQANSAMVLDYAQINPYAFAPPVSPHIAAQQAGVSINLAVIAAHYDYLREIAEGIVVEGIGGWLTPLSETETVADLARRLNLPVILVVGLRIGCINHAVLTAKAVLAEGLTLMGWVGNRVNPDMDFLAENIDALLNRLDAPCLGILPHANEGIDENWLNTAEQTLVKSLPCDRF